MDRIDLDKIDAGFPANGEFLKYINEQLSKLHTHWEDESENGGDHIIKGINVVATSTTTSLSKGLIYLNGEVFAFEGAVLDTTDRSKIDLYVQKEVKNQNYGDLASYPAYRRRKLLARISEAGGNFLGIHKNRNFSLPIVEKSKNIKIAGITGTNLHGNVEHTKEKVRVNTTIQTNSAGVAPIYIFPFASNQEIFNVYPASNGFKTFEWRLAGQFHSIMFDNSGTIIGEVKGDIIQQNAVFYFYETAKRKLGATDLTGSEIVPIGTAPDHAKIMLEFDIIRT